MTPAEALNRPARTYDVTTHVHQRVALQYELIRLRRILAEEEAR